MEESNFNCSLHNISMVAPELFILLYLACDKYEQQPRMEVTHGLVYYTTCVWVVVCGRSGVKGHTGPLEKKNPDIHCIFGTGNGAQPPLCSHTMILFFFVPCGSTEVGNRIV